MVKGGNAIEIIQDLRDSLRYLETRKIMEAILDNLNEIKKYYFLMHVVRYTKKRGYYFGEKGKSICKINLWESPDIFRIEGYGNFSDIEIKFRIL